MRKIDKEGKRLCDIQADLFEKSVSALEMSSEVFVRRFMNSKIAIELDNKAFLDDSKTINDIFKELDLQYGKTTYGSLKYNKDIMYWAGYLYRYFCYTYDLSSKQAYKYLPLKYVASTFVSYHSLDVSQAIERLHESKGISFKEEDILRKGVDILRVIKNVEDPYVKFPILGNERFLLRKVEDGDAKDLLSVYSDKESVKFFNCDNCNGDDFNYTTIERMQEAISFWKYSYENRFFVRWAIVDKINGLVVGTIEQFHRDSNDYFTNCSLLRLDLKSDYEKKDIIVNVLKLIIPSSYNLFNCEKVVTKSFDDDIERENALYELGFKNPNKTLIGHNGEKYYNYYELLKK